MRDIILLGILGLSIVGANNRHGGRPNAGQGWRQSRPLHHNTDYDQYDFGQQAELFDVGDDTQQIVDNDFEDFPGIVPSRHYQTESPRIVSTTPPSRTPLSPIRYGDNRNQPQVTTSIGKIRGKKVRLTTGKTIYEFLGVPFAKPPIGDLRFKRPVAIDTFDTPYEATQLPNACVQEMFHMDGFAGEEIWNPNTNISEDCLYLNVWVPETVFNEKDNKLVSLLFWIYGGGFFMGSSSLPMYNGAYLAGQEGVIVVSTQYRLGPLGFLYLGTDEAPGNVGLWDQNLALKWVHDHIVNFGGDAASVTLFGESCGSVSIGHHLVSAQSKPYFKRAVMMSGTSVETVYGFVHPNILRNRSYKLAKMVGCNIQQSVEEVAACLRQQDSKTLMRLQGRFTNNKMLNEAGFKPTLDGNFIKDFPANVVNNGEAKRADLIIGSVKTEGSYFVLSKYLKYFHYDKSTSVTRDRFVEIMKDIFGDFSDLELEAILNNYTNWENPEDGFLNQQRISEAVGDHFFVCPNRKFADTWSNRGLNVFYYHFTHRSSSSPWAEWMGVMHSDEIPYFLGHPMNSSKTFTPSERQLSIYMTKLLANFAKTGTPSENWERYTSEVPIYLDLNATLPSDKSNPNKYGPRANECILWNKFLPQLRRLSILQRQVKRQQQYANFDHAPNINRGIHGGQGFHWDNMDNLPEDDQVYSQCQAPFVTPMQQPIAPAVYKNFGRNREFVKSRDPFPKSCRKCCDTVVDTSTTVEGSDNDGVYVTPIPF